ncbi:hypothetical protein [Oceanicella actignis]|uniref:hypothetical protein n=1 Tax=Oceanicella actignis TaxID=1189325 RepID=UPI0011E7EAB6|nr:hypothetical protein [Oceanicella actignis]TYO84851.1 hypothetical protein LY05_02824 [Oceanicella actignis]
MTTTAEPRPLVVLRIGADHRVGGWARAPRAARSWDLVLSPYQRVPDLDAFAPDEAIPIAGGKWDALHRLFSARPDLLERERIWLPDDDIEADGATVERLFAMARAHDLALCQPALTRDSVFSHFVTVQHRGTRLRRTNFVELMAPMMVPCVLRAALPLMEGRRGGKGLDYVWHRFAPPGAVAVIDAAPVAHRRPLGRHLAARAAAAGGDLAAERAAFFAAHPEAAGHWPMALSAPGAGGPPAMAALSLWTLATDPRLWRPDKARRAALAIGAQLVGPLLGKG